MPDKNGNVDKFLEIISQLESSGGQNIAHQPIEAGIHQGTTAMGQYGLMPNTVKEITVRMKQRGEDTPEIDQFAGLEPDQMAQKLTPDMESTFAHELANKVLQKQGNDEEAAAYSWRMGHNLQPEQVKERNYVEHPYVREYKRLRKIMNNE